MCVSINVIHFLLATIVILSVYIPYLVSISIIVLLWQVIEMHKTIKKCLSFIHSSSHVSLCHTCRYYEHQCYQIYQQGKLKEFLSNSYGEMITILVKH